MSGQTRRKSACGAPPRRYSATLPNDIVIRGMSWKLPKLVPRSAPAVLILLLLAAVAGFAAVTHLVNRFNANQQARGRRLYAQGLADVDAGKLNHAVEDFRAALTCDPSNSEYQLASEAPCVTPEILSILMIESIVLRADWQPLTGHARWRNFVAVISLSEGGLNGIHIRCPESCRSSGTSAICR